MTKVNQKNVISIIEGLLLTNKIVTWDDIKTNVEAKIKVKNWLDVRNILQSIFIHYNEAIRTENLYVEEYKSTICA